jgi:putative flippase GtrA
MQLLDYKTAYSAAYLAGVAIAFVVSRTFVFRTHNGWRSLALFPLVYIAQYGVSLAVVWAWVEVVRLPKVVAPLAAIAVTVPLTYLLSKVVFRPTKREDI